MFISASRWSVGCGPRCPAVLEIAYGREAHFPQYAALHTQSSYLRLTGGAGMAWGTSVVLLPVVWEAEHPGPTQGAPIQTTACREEAGTLALDFKGGIAGLVVTGHLRFSPPADDTLRVDVAVAVSGKTRLNTAHAPEAFKTVMLSSMYVSPDLWDTDRAFAGEDTRDIPHPQQWLFPPSRRCHAFGLRGGCSRWQHSRQAPTVAIAASEAMHVAGWVCAPGKGRRGGPNSDNVALWAAHDHVRAGWRYTIIAQAEHWPATETRVSPNLVSAAFTPNGTPAPASSGAGVSSSS